MYSTYAMPSTILTVKRIAVILKQKLSAKYFLTIRSAPGDRMLGTFGVTAIVIL